VQLVANRRRVPKPNNDFECDTNRFLEEDVSGSAKRALVIVLTETLSGYQEFPEGIADPL
tara:strand:- start:1707 stop:1886 length:180 start_codon:yes stop_codon:yes gene_type:complete